MNCSTWDSSSSMLPLMQRRELKYFYADVRIIPAALPLMQRRELKYSGRHQNCQMATVASHVEA